MSKIANIRKRRSLKINEHPVYGGCFEIKTITEEVTIAAAAYSDSLSNLLPANSLIMGVSFRVTKVIPTATTFDVGYSGSANAYFDDVAVAANTNGVKHLASEQSSAAKVRITPSDTPAAATGKVRITVHYAQITANSS